MTILRQQTGLENFLFFRGGAHGGHYFAYIRDIDAYGVWTHPVSESTPSKDIHQGVLDIDT